MCQSYTTQRVQRPNLKAVIINAFHAKPPPGPENTPATPTALGTQAAHTPVALTTTDPRNIIARSPATPQKARTPGTHVEPECSVIPAWKLFAADW